MITLRIDHEKELRKIEKKLGSLKSEAPRVLANAVNQTAKDARKKLATQAQKTYAIKTSGFNKEMKIKRARASNPVAVISATGKANELKSFKVSPSKYAPSEPPDAYQAKVVKAGSMKTLVKGDIKSFLIRFKSSHVTVAQRVGRDRLPIRVLYSLSVPTMIGSELRVYGLIKPELYKDLQANIDKQIARVIAKGGR